MYLVFFVFMLSQSTQILQAEYRFVETFQISTWKLKSNTIDVQLYHRSDFKIQYEKSLLSHRTSPTEPRPASILARMSVVAVVLA